MPFIRIFVRKKGRVETGKIRRWAAEGAEKWRAFRQWQLKPHVVKPLSDEHRECSTCGTKYQGNFCPRCGQPAVIGRYSFKKAFLLFLDVWGLGNRGMFRTLRDLILRPGHMIRDYLSGMQMAYFPPFKMFFLLATLNLIVDSGANVKFKNYIVENQTTVSTTENRAEETVKSVDAKAEKDNSVSRYRHFVDDFFEWAERFPNISMLLLLVFLSGIMYVFYRRCPAIPDLRYSEFLVAQVYISNMVSMYLIVFSFFCIEGWVSLLPLLMPFIPLKQMSGFSWWKLIGITVLSIIVALVAFLLLLLVASRFV